MQLSDAQRMACSLLSQHGLTHWSFGWNRRKRALGLCRYTQHRVELSTHFVLDNDEPLVLDTILHEIAHAIAGRAAGHGPRWKACCLKLGCKPERCDKGEAIMPRGSWIATCVNCGKEYGRHRRPEKSARYFCRKCGPGPGAIQFLRNNASAYRRPQPTVHTVPAVCNVPAPRKVPAGFLSNW